MRKLFKVISFLALSTLCFLGCHKDPLNSPGPVNTGKGCRVVDYSDSISSITPGDVWHLHFQYNDTDQLVRFDVGNSQYYTIAYDAQGHISKINSFKGSSNYTSFTVVYTADFITQVNYLDGAGNSSFSLSLSWNVNGLGELDKIDVPKTQFSNSGYLAYVYSSNQGFAEYHEGSTEPLHPYDRIVVQSIPVNIRPAVTNPFLDSTTKDERFLYWFFLNGIGPIDRLSALNGGGWNDDILAYYSYDANGKKSEYARVKFEFILDSNNNVIKRIAYKAADAPGFSNYVKLDENVISYQCK